MTVLADRRLTVAEIDEVEGVVDEVCVRVIVLVLVVYSTVVSTPEVVCVRVDRIVEVVQLVTVV